MAKLRPWNRNDLLRFETQVRLEESLDFSPGEIHLRAPLFICHVY